MTVRRRPAGRQTAGPMRLEDLGEPPKGPAGVVVDGQGGSERADKGQEGDQPPEEQREAAGGEPPPDPQRAADKAARRGILPIAVNSPSGPKHAAPRRRESDWQMLELADALRVVAAAIPAADTSRKRQDLHRQTTRMAEALVELAEGTQSPWVLFARLAHDLGQADNSDEVRQVTQQLLGWPATTLYAAARDEPVVDLRDAAVVIEAAAVGPADDPSFREEMEREGVGVWVGDFSRPDGYRAFVRLNPDARHDRVRGPVKVVDLAERRRRAPS